MKLLPSRWLLRPIDCTPEGRKVCQGLCCCNLVIHYTPQEIELLPAWVREMLNNGKLEQGERCPLSSHCNSQWVGKPDECKMFPLGINKGNRLIIRNWAVWRCPNHGKGEPAYISLKGDIISVFGEEVYNSLISQMNELGWFSKQDVLL